MMTKSNKFGFGPVETKSVERRRSVGPMGAAVREAAASMTESTEAKIEQRRRNAEDAKAFRAAQDEGRVLVTLPLDAIHTDDLPRDRLELDAVAVSDEMEELKDSIRSRGQKEPAEVYVDADGRYQLKKGWRRLTALRQLLAETGEERFATFLVRVASGEERIARYIDMVEENVVREDLSFAEMAQVVLSAASDPAIDETDADALVNRLYGSLHKMKRSYIRSFVYLLSELGDVLPHPKAIARNLGVEVARRLKDGQGVSALRASLQGAASPEAQQRALEAFAWARASADPGGEPKQKFEFFVDGLKVTARKGECRIVGKEDFASVPRARLEKAIKAFRKALEEDDRSGNPRVTSL